MASLSLNAETKSDANQSRSCHFVSVCNQRLYLLSHLNMKAFLVNVLVLFYDAVTDIRKRNFLKHSVPPTMYCVAYVQIHRVLGYMI